MKQQFIENTKLADMLGEKFGKVFEVRGDQDGQSVQLKYPSGNCSAYLANYTGTQLCRKDWGQTLYWKAAPKVSKGIDSRFAEDVAEFLRELYGHKLPEIGCRV